VNYYTKPFVGVFENYDNSGYSIDIETSYEYFNETMDYLQKVSWVDSLTNSLMLNMMFYNVNLDVFVIVRVFFENLGAYFKPNVDYGLIDVEFNDDASTYICIVFSVLNIAFIFLSLKKSSREKNLIKKQLNTKMQAKITSILEDGDGKTSTLKQIKIFFVKTHYELKKTFKKPNFFQALCKINIITYIITNNLSL